MFKISKLASFKGSKLTTPTFPCPETPISTPLSGSDYSLLLFSGTQMEVGVASIFLSDSGQYFKAGYKETSDSPSCLPTQAALATP